MSSEGSSVQLFVYDMSRGMAKSLSMMFLGKEISGLWHTAIVAYGREHFFGGAGIQCCDPGTTMLGEPEQRIELGYSEIPFDLFMEYIYSLASSSFAPEKYELFTHNCNNFSNELAVFLTGNEIPKHILDLPNDVLNSPLGPLIRSAFSNVQITPGGHSLSLTADHQQQQTQPNGQAAASVSTEISAAPNSPTPTSSKAKANDDPLD